MFIIKIETAEDLQREFEAHGRDYYSLEAYQAMLDMAEGNDYELDVVGLCCQYSEYDSIEKAYLAYNSEGDLESLKQEIKEEYCEKDEEPDEETQEEIEEELEDRMRESLDYHQCCYFLDNGGVLVSD